MVKSIPIEQGESPCNKGSDWVAYNHLTNTYDTKDGTTVAVELFENAQCFADILHIARIRDEQRETKHPN